MRLKKVTIYFTEEEYAALQAIADDEEVTLGAVVRAKLGLAYKRRGRQSATPIAGYEPNLIGKVERERVILDCSWPDRMTDRDRIPVPGVESCFI